MTGVQTCALPIFKITKSITNRESQSLEKYLQEIGKVEMVSPEEEAKLAKKIRHGDQSALERLTKANLRFVVSVAKQYQNQGLSLPDLINEGNLGLIKAAQRFDVCGDYRGRLLITPPLQRIKGCDCLLVVSPGAEAVDAVGRQQNGSPCPQSRYGIQRPSTTRARPARSAVTRTSS